MFGNAYIFNNRIGLFVLTFTYIILSVSTNEIKTHKRKPSESEPINDTRYHEDLNKVKSTLGEGSCGKDKEFYNGKDLKCDRFANLKQIKNVNPRVGCVVFLNINNSQATDVKETWGRKCSFLIFIGQHDDTSLPVIGLNGNMKNNINTLIPLIWSNYMYLDRPIIYNNVYENNADWLLIANDNTFVFMENLKAFLSQFKSNNNYYFGAKVWSSEKNKIIPPWINDNPWFPPKEEEKNRTFMFEGAGYVLSYGLVLRMQSELKRRPYCTGSLIAGKEVEKCLFKTRVMDTRDYHGKHRFLPFGPESMFSEQVPGWWWTMLVYQGQSGEDCCSVTPISFGSIQPNHMHYMQYLFYDIKKHKRG